MVTREFKVHKVLYTPFSIDELPDSVFLDEEGRAAAVGQMISVREGMIE